jgi:hypothetical protein
MAETRFIQKPKKKKTRPEEDETAQKPATSLSEDKKRKLQELDDFIDDVLEKAGEEFLEDFKQVEGE